MDLLSTGRVRRVICHQRGPCISLYHLIGGEDDLARRGSLVERAAVQLLETFSSRGNRRAAPLVAALDRLVRQATESSSGAAIATFCAPGFETSFVLPNPVVESVRVADRFDVRPILALWKDPTRFYLLAVEGAQARMGLGTSRGLALSEIPLEDPARTDRRLARMLRLESAPVVIAATREAQGTFDQLRRLTQVITLPDELAGQPLTELHQHAVRAAASVSQDRTVAPGFGAADDNEDVND